MYVVCTLAASTHLQQASDLGQYSLGMACVFTTIVRVRVRVRVRVLCYAGIIRSEFHSACCLAIDQHWWLDV